MTKILSAIVLLVGSLQIVGHLVESPSIRGLGLISAASPLPLVFSHFRGAERFAADFELEILSADNQTERFPITPTLYSRLRGPYNRRNVFGAAIAFGPALNKENEQSLWQSVLQYGFCDPGVLISEFQIELRPKEVTVHIQSRTAGKTDQTWKLLVRCP